MHLFPAFDFVNAVNFFYKENGLFLCFSFHCESIQQQQQSFSPTYFGVSYGFSIDWLWPATCESILAYNFSGKKNSHCS